MKEVKKEESKKEIIESKPAMNLKGKKSKKEPRVKEKEVEKKKKKIRKRFKKVKKILKKRVYKNWRRK